MATYGQELFKDPGFDNPGDWTFPLGVTIAGGQLVYDGVTHLDNVQTTLNESKKLGSLYKFEFTQASGTSRMYFHSGGSTFSSPADLSNIITRPDDIFYQWEDALMLNTTTAFNFYCYNDDGAGAFVLDSISLKEVLPDPITTTVEIEWIDSISAAATGNKIYRDDVEIADIANGVQFYSDPNAPAGTESKYEVQAYSATDETTQEVLGVNVQYITTA